MPLFLFNKQFITNINHPTSFQYKCLPFLIMLQMTIAICHLAFLNKTVATYFGVISAGSMTVPFWAMLDDIITEIYGFKISIQTYWLTMLVLFLLSTIIFIATRIPSPFFWNEYDTYTEVFKFSMLLIPYGIIMGIIAYRLNAYLLIKLKILLNGKVFWLRSLSSTIISDLFFLMLMTPAILVFGPAENIKEAIYLSIASLIFRIIFYIILAFPSSFIVNILKIIERVTIHETQVNFNPFKKPVSVEET